MDELCSKGKETGEDGLVRKGEIREIWSNSLERYIHFCKHRTITGDGFPPSKPDVTPKTTLRHRPHAS
ncbi:hypothetical protein MHYP_G00015650 [Metynnis hypsauchen]